METVEHQSTEINKKTAEVLMNFNFNLMRMEVNILLLSDQ